MNDRNYIVKNSLLFAGILLLTLVGITLYNKVIELNSKHEKRLEVLKDYKERKIK